MEKPHSVQVIIPLKTVLTLILSLLAVWVVYQVRDVLVLFLIVVAIVVAFSPIIRSWEKVMPRTLAIVLLYALLLLSLIIVGVLIIPVFLSQLRGFLLYIQDVAAFYGFNSGNIYQQIRQIQGGPQAIGQLFAQFQGSLGTLFSTTLGVVGGLVAGFTVFISSFYLLLEEKNMQTFLASIIPVSHHKQVGQVVDHISEKMGSYLRGQVLLMVSIGLIDGIAMALLGVPYALLLGLWAGIMELLPYVGPILGALPGVLLATTQMGVTKGLIVLFVFSTTAGESVFSTTHYGQSLRPQPNSDHLCLSDWRKITWLCWIAYCHSPYRCPRRTV